MSGQTHSQRIIALLLQKPGLDDDEIAKQLGIEPRQTVNQVCRHLATNGVLQRERGATGKIVNNIAVGSALSAKPAQVSRVTSRPNATQRDFDSPFIPEEFAKTLLVIPCSGEKRNFDVVGRDGPAIAQSLPKDIAVELMKARECAKSLVPFDERRLVPAWQRYDGSLYESGRNALADLMAAGMHVIILSGGYGVVLAQEPIGSYNARLVPSWWPNRLIERALVAYAQHHEIASVRAFVSATGPYATVLKRVRWGEAGIDDALMLTPEPEPGGMRRSPATQGQALAALRDGVLSPAWRSSYGLGLIAHAG
ncbi:hypothetical protein [Methylocystis sp.]|uniref:hypothetical protein n=1 Tax=Methylocystis sp. TaxID=1911079 RepID=UPI0025D9A8D2|nr:hypothetical protein [Methylocystis sp.]